MEISQEGIALIKRFEGCKLQAYKCSAGVPTIGFGSTRGVEMGMEISQERAEALLLEDVADFEEEVNKCVEVPLTQNQFDALVSFSFNLGLGTLQRSTVRSALLRGDEEAAIDTLLKYRRAGGKILRGLERRRAAEADLFFSHIK